jgi:hypothetical protein
LLRLGKDGKVSDESGQQELTRFLDRSKGREKSRKRTIEHGRKQEKKKMRERI